jgi:16S rRNA (guanine966-N2)-methyltransferase
MGLEALSRGARRCVFVESDRAACRAIAANLEKLQLTGALVACHDAFAALRQERAAGRRYDLVVVDPPYGSWPELEGRLAAALPPLLTEDGLLVVETDARTEPQLPLDPVTSRRYGSARLTLFRP